MIKLNLKLLIHVDFSLNKNKELPLDNFEKYFLSLKTYKK